MRDQDLDLIAALAAGELTGSEASHAQELVARGGEYQAEFEAQQLALSSLQDARPARMSDLERARLHKAVMAEVAGPPAVSTPAPAEEPRSIRWLRPLAVAAATVVVVGFAGVILTRGDSQVASFSDLAAETTEARQPAAEDALSTATTQQMTEAVGDAEAPPSADAIDTAGGEERALTGSSAKPLNLGSISSRDIDEQYLTEIYLGAAQFTSDAPGSLEGNLLSCAEAASALSDEPLLAFGTAEYDGEAAQYFGFVSRRLLFLDAESCDILGEHP